jgi:hypothetical protein
VPAIGSHPLASAGHSSLLVTMDRYGHKRAMDEIAHEMFG